MNSELPDDDSWQGFAATMPASFDMLEQLETRKPAADPAPAPAPAAARIPVPTVVPASPPRAAPASAAAPARVTAAVPQAPARPQPAVESRLSLARPAVPARPMPPAASEMPQLQADASQVLRLVVRGLKAIERQLLEGTVRLSQRRTPRLEVLDEDDALMADVVIVDATDPASAAWARERPWLRDKAVIWVDAPAVPPGHTLARRPVQWPILPMLLARALEQGPMALLSSSKPAPAPSPAPAATAHGGAPVPQLRSAAPAASPPSGAAPAAPARPAAPAQPAPAPHAHRILVVDDSLAVRNHLRSQLEARGLAVSEADCGEAGLLKASQGRYDCVLMDVLMPGMDGYEACRRIKAATRRERPLPIVMLTSKSSPFDRIRGKMAGCDAYLTKPVEPAQLAAVLEQQIGAFGARARS